MIKLFEQFNNEQEIHNICKKYKIINYTINPGGSIDVDGDVNLSGLVRDKIPIKFNVVSGEFFCFRSYLTSLEGCPKKVDGDIYIGVNYLTELEGCPLEVRGLYCDHNNITTLKGCPIIINGNFDLRYNPISIIDSSVEVKGDINIGYTNFDDKIKSLSQKKLRILFEHGVDYDIFRKDGSINDYRLERMFKDFNI